MNNQKETITVSVDDLKCAIKTEIMILLRQHQAELENLQQRIDERDEAFAKMRERILKIIAELAGVIV